jgi:hypothetical protein
MNTTLLRQALLGATVSQLEEVIDWLDRPWAPGRNDALRAAWHEARRSDGARRALAYAIEEEVRSLSPERDLPQVAARLGLASRTNDTVAEEIVRRLRGISSPAFPFSLELVAGALRATAEIARLVLADGPRHRRRHGRHHRHAR